MSMHVFGRKPHVPQFHSYGLGRPEGDRIDHIDGSEDRHYSVHSGDGQMFDFPPVQRTGSFSPPTGGVFIGGGGKIPRRSGLDFCVKENMRTHAPCVTRELSGVHDSYTVAGGRGRYVIVRKRVKPGDHQRTSAVAATITEILVVESTATTLLNWKSLTKMVRMLPSAQPQP